MQKTKTVKTKSRGKSNTGHKSKISKGMIIEIILLALSLLNTAFTPLPWRLIYPFIIGIYTIFIKYRSDRRLMRVALVESTFMALEIAANLLPLYWRLGAFFLLGVRSIVIRYKHKHSDGNNCYCDKPDKPAKRKSK